MRGIAWILLLPWLRDIACGESAAMWRLYATLRRCPLSGKQMGRALPRRRASVTRLCHSLRPVRCLPAPRPLRRRDREICPS